MLFSEEDEQQRILNLLHRRLEALNTALRLRNAPTILQTSNHLKSELLMLGFAKLADVVMEINDTPLDKSLGEEFQQLWIEWRDTHRLQT